MDNVLAARYSHANLSDLHIREIGRFNLYRDRQKYRFALYYEI